jgi:hypothetical protein
MLVQQSKQSLKRLIAGFALGAVMATTGSAAYAINDPVVFSFATVGDTRQDPDGPDSSQLLPPNSAGGKLLTQDKLWLQNSKAWGRILRSVQAQKPKMFFINGDMVMGYRNPVVPASWSSAAPTLSQVVNSDITQLYVQYAFWRGMVVNAMETGTYIMPVPGNHEVQCKTTISQNGVACPNGNKQATADNENAFRANMGDLIGDLTTNQRFRSIVGKAATNVRGLTSATAPLAADTVGGTDQSYLSYSFDIETNGAILHFAVINTDPTGNDSHAPTNWLTSDFSAAAARGLSAMKPVKYFVFGHKMAFTYNYQASGAIAAGGLDTDTTSRNNFWRLIAQYNAAYFCGHEHVTHLKQYADPTSTYTAKNPWQVLVGAGGSPFDAFRACTYDANGVATSCSAAPTTAGTKDRWYGWALVKIRQSGAVDLELYGFSDSFGATTKIQTVTDFQ